MIFFVIRQQFRGDFLAAFKPEKRINCLIFTFSKLLRMKTQKVETYCRFGAAGCESSATFPVCTEWSIENSL